MRGRAAVVVLCTSLLATIISATPGRAGSSRPIGDIRIFTTLGYPGHPGGLAVDGRTLYIDTSGGFDRDFDGSDQVWSYNLDSRKPLATKPNPIVVKRALPAQPMGLLGIALDAAGRLYITDMNGRVDRVDPRTGSQEVYATIPTSTDTSLTDMPCFDAFLPDGSLLVTDCAGEPIIWRVPPGGGTAQPWFVDPRLGGTWGSSVLGLAIDPNGKDLYFSAGNQWRQATIYRLPLASPDAAHLEPFHAYDDVVIEPCMPDQVLNFIGCAVTTALGPSGIAFGASGKLYVSLLSKNQLSVLRPDGSEELRLPSADDNMKRDVPFNTPFSVAFDGRGSLLLSNTGEPTWSRGPDGSEFPLPPTTSKTWVVFDIYVNDTALPLTRPVIG